MKRVVLRRNNVCISRTEEDSVELVKKGWEIVEPKAEKKPAKKSTKKED